MHGGGFYHIQKYLVAPERMPEHLTWFKWESYATWLSGFAMLAIVYYAGADLFLVDRAVLDVPAWVAILISLASLGVGWVLYDNLCKSKLAENPTTLMVLLFVILVAMAWGYTQVFTGRAALLHLGAFTATIMSANVFLVIIPNQTIVVADLKAGRTPDPKYGAIAKLRSTHNNYLTLPVLFLMLSNHYPLAFATEYNWIIASLVFLMGVTIRHYFNTMHAPEGNAELDLGGDGDHLRRHHVAVERAGQPARGAGGAVADAGALRRSAEGFAAVADTVRGRCSMCHAAEVFWPGLHRAPKGVILETDAEIAAQAREIYLQAGRSHAMPPGNVTGDRAGGAAADRRLVPRGDRRAEAGRLSDRRKFSAFGPRRLWPIITRWSAPRRASAAREAGGCAASGRDARSSRPARRPRTGAARTASAPASVSGPWRSAPRDARRRAGRPRRRAPGRPAGRGAAGRAARLRTPAVPARACPPAAGSRRWRQWIALGALAASRIVAAAWSAGHAAAEAPMRAGRRRRLRHRRPVARRPPRRRPAAAPRRAAAPADPALAGVTSVRLRIGPDVSAGAAGGDPGGAGGGGHRGRCRSRRCRSEIATSRVGYYRAADLRGRGGAGPG